MQRPIIFIATSDPSFETTARRAITETGHGMRCVRNLRDACHSLGEGTSDIALAIVDLEMEGMGLFLLRILGGYEPPFPVLAITNSGCAGGVRENITHMGAGQIDKPVGLGRLTSIITEICRLGDTARDAGFSPSCLNA